jgi:predicted DNA-binding transcriptional regulator AlpA
MPTRARARKDKPLISVAEAGRRLGISESAAYRLAAAGSLPGLVRLAGTRKWVRARVLDSWLAGNDPPHYSWSQIPTGEP